MSDRRRTAMVLLVSLGALSWALAAGGAEAGTGGGQVKSTVKITSGAGAKFTGKVLASKAACRAKRTVKLYFESGDSARTGGEAGASGASELVGTAKTNAAGVWTIKGNFMAGVYYAAVVAKIVHSEGLPVHCGFDLSLHAHF
jgi:hypothetical protein